VDHVVEVAFHANIMADERLLAVAHDLSDALEGE
jgi:hypothetical protein